MEMEEDKRQLNIMLFLPELFCMLLVVSGIYGVSYIEQLAFDKTLSCMVMAVLGVTLVGFRIRREYLDDELHYDNAKHLFRFWLGFLGGIAVSFACVFLPVEGWPFLPVFVMLSLFSSPVAGIAASIVLMMIPALLSAASVGVFFLYLLSGIFGVCLFCRIENEVKIGIPLFLSVLSLLVCETASLILTANKRPGFEDFVVPMVNLIISCVLLLVLIKVFSTQVVYPLRVQYLELNDTESEILVKCKKEDRDKYFHGVHTAYFCERIAGKFSMDVNAIKCAAYYHKIVEEDPAIMLRYKFPPAAIRLLNEYITRDQGEHDSWEKETAVLLCADEIVSRITKLLKEDKNATPDYDKIVDSVFKKFDDRKVFYNSNLTLKELISMHKIFKEEKLYYDFLR